MDKMISTLAAAVRAIVIVALFAGLIAPVSLAFAVEDAPGGTWVRRSPSGFGSSSTFQIHSLEVFNGALYAAAESSVTGVTLWRSTNSTSWEKVNPTNVDPESTIVPFAAQSNILDMHVYNGMLYAAASWGSEELKQVWRSADGNQWEQITDPSFSRTGIEMFTVFSTYNNQLFLSDYHGVLSSPSGDTDTWSVSLGNLSGAIFAMTVYGDHLYAGGLNSGGVIIRRFNGTNWTTVNTAGFGDSNNDSIGGFAVFNGALYTGTNNPVTGGQIWRYLDVEVGEDWTQVMGDGFQNTHSNKVEGLLVYNDRLYAALNDNSVSPNSTSALQIWSSADGVNWTLSKDFRGEPARNTWTHWNNAFVVFDNSIYIGTRNLVRGAEIWSYPGRAIFLPMLHR